MAQIQKDRSHEVISGGPQRCMRHPGYASGLVTYLATPFFLNSRSALATAVIPAILPVYRTYLKDTMIQQELPGYSDYTRGARYRLLPGVR
jgi:protein-S-isoprenylcysteine O-methyltransferase Ste14